MNLAIVGAGYVGLTTGAALAYLGNRVICVEKDRSKLSLLGNGICPILEPGLAEMMGMLRFTSDPHEAIPDAEVIMIAVGTPSREDGSSDTRYVEDAAREVAEAMEDGRSYTVVMKSTVPVGTNRRVAHIIGDQLRRRDKRSNVNVVSNPEFLSEGQALRDFLYPDRIVVGAESPEGVDVMRRLYRPILEQSFEPPVGLPRPSGYSQPPLIATDTVSAEMIKYASNAFLAVKISFINEIAALCERVGADVQEVARGMGLDPRIGTRFLQAGAGWGGSCFPKDTAALVALGQELGCEMPIVLAAREVNFRQRRRLVEKLQNALLGVRGRVIGVLGISFKPCTDDIREAPALEIIKLLIERGAHVRAHDPAAMENARNALQEVEFFEDPYRMADGADALVLLTEWPEYRELDLSKIAKTMRTPV
ncbi:MAG: UDP-glucose/GDP-mannose dehydrogenase family protein, partial [Methanothrix sp.]|uniref:UDP-glucose dehydrogenase family protein n=1 Tax=Methanothrix sp. TaxID=90426 RepID=UPI0025F3896B